MRGLRLCGRLPNSGETFADWVERAIAFYHQGSELVNLGCVTMTQVVGIGTFAQVKQDSSGSVVYKCFDSEQLKRGIEQDGTIFQPAGFLASGFWNDLALTPYILDFGVRILDDICDYYLKMPRLKKSILADRSRMKVASIEEKENLARQVVTLAADECRRGVVHGDIKRNNIMEDSSGSLRLIDYSLASRFSDPEKMRLRYWENQMSPRLPDNPKLDVEFCAATLVDVFMALERNDLLFSVIYALKRPERDSEFSLIPPRLRPVLRDALSSFFIPNAAAFEAAVNQALSVG